MLKFTTKLILKKDKEEKYLFPVLTQHSYNYNNKNENTKFELNLAALEGFGFTPDTPNVNKINWGVDESTGKLLLANTKGLVENKISNITANNTFSNLTFMDRLVKEFHIDSLQVHEFTLDLQTDEEGIVVATIILIEEEVPTQEFTPTEEEPMSDTPLEAVCDTWNEKDLPSMPENLVPNKNIW